ncbi:MAG TPA: HlyD family efflux transporter periplasmic adaptor subunit [Anaerolineales bacterium]|nr:HlyD family efflux transporter periplasmic adaptor subunit [Anaerolineales bacterium]
MNHKLPPLPVRIVIVLIVIAAILYFTIGNNNTAGGQLKASGTIESVTVNVSPEMAGKVKDVLVGEGESVKAGNPLLSLDDSLLTAQRAVAAAQLDSANSAVTTAEAALAAAQVQYDLAFDNAVLQSDAVRTVDWFRDEPAAFDLPLWYYSQTEQIHAAQSEVDLAKAALEAAESNLASVLASAGSADFVKAETDLASARASYQVAKDIYDRIQNGLTSEDLSRPQLIKVARGDLFVSRVGQDLRDSAKKNYDDAKSKLDETQVAYNDALTTDGAKDVLQARAEISIAQERYYTAMDYVLSLHIGESSSSVTAAQKALEQAQSVVDQAKTAIGQAQANLDLIDIQMTKLTIYAPMDGVILTRNVEPGEFVQPGAVALTMANLNDLTITVYVPETRLNEIKLGQPASVTIDVQSGQSPVFDAEVLHIADQAEFTPRNVQTVEGRSSTVYAIKLKVIDNDGKLKIGMPADVAFK